jgi:hypothetical protein
MSILGLISDTHGRDLLTLEAARLLRARGAEVLIHLGDIGSEAVLDALVDAEVAVAPSASLDDGAPKGQRETAGSGARPPAVRIVFGNTDYDADDLARHARVLGIHVDDPVGRIEVDWKSVVFTHGHLQREVQEALRAPPDYLCHGHTHVVRDDRVGRTRILNPGALHRARRHTVGLLDVAADRFEVLEVRAQ